MPRRKSSVPPATRIRENQRRSRARKAELITNLQQRLRAYETKELQATISMQQATRKVAWENVRLRQLLVSKGVSDREIDEFVYGHEWASTGVTVASTYMVTGDRPLGWSTSQAPRGQNVGSTRVESPLTRLDTSASNVSIPPKETSIDANLHGYNSRSGLPIQEPRLEAELATEDWSSSENDCSCDFSDTTSTITGEQQRRFQTASKCPGRVARSPSRPRRDDSALEMCCESAARIIAGIRANADIDMARSELGCNKGEQCKVKNIEVLQVMGMG